MEVRNQPTYIIAEAGVNHNGDINLALQLIDIAVDSGADAIKFQTFVSEKLVSIHASKAIYQKNTTDPAESQFQMLKKLELSESDHFILKAYCEKKNITFLSTPFDSVSADFLLDQLKLSTIKIASGEIATAPLLLQIAKSGASIILSTGMSTLGDIEEALGVLAFGYLNYSAKPSKTAFMEAYYSSKGQKILQEKVTLLHCTSDYPAQFDHINLYAMDTLRSAFNLSIGYSDHSVGIAISIAAVARGATIIEKHFTIDRNLPGPDHQASLEPDELKNMVKTIREVELALGKSIKVPTSAEIETRLVARKSLIALQPISCDQTFTEQNLGMQRPGFGISPVKYWDYLNMTARRDYEVGELIDE